jgi:hypothetical protein
MRHKRVQYELGFSASVAANLHLVVSHEGHCLVQQGHHHQHKDSNLHLLQQLKQAKQAIASKPSLAFFLPFLRAGAFQKVLHSVYRFAQVTKL